MLNLVSKFILSDKMLAIMAKRLQKMADLADLADFVVNWLSNGKILNFEQFEMLILSEKCPKNVELNIFFSIFGRFCGQLAFK